MNDLSQTEGNNMKQAGFLQDDYSPADDEPFMNDLQVEYFRRKLNNWSFGLRMADMSIAS